MSIAYWSQWNHADIMSMHGMELNEPDMSVCQDEYDIELCQEEEEGLSMKSLGLSWRDFL